MNALSNVIAAPTTRIANRQRLLLSLSLLAVGALLGGCGRSDISERPPRADGAGAPQIATQPSTIGALVAIPLAQSIQAANTALPRSYGQDWTNGEDACVDLGLLGKHCVGTKYRYNVSRGDIAITAVGTNAVKLSVHVSLNGQGGFRGDLSKWIKADAKNFDAAANVEIVLTPTMGSDWCPSIGVAPSYNWTKNPRVEIVSKVNVDVSGQVNKVLDSKLPQIAQAVQQSINCAQFKSQLAAVYGNKTFPIEITPGQKMYLNVEPLDFAFSGFNVDTQAIRLAAMLTAKVELSGKPTTPSVLPLPSLKTIGVEAPPRTSIAVPLRAPFALLQTEAQKLASGKTFKANAAGSEVMATLKNVEIYPTSGGKVAVGIDFDAKLPGKLLDTKGIVFVVGTLVAEGPTGVRLKDPTFTRILDNDAWNLLSVLFESQIRGELDKSLRYSFAGDVTKAKKALADKLAEPTRNPQIKAKVTDVDIALVRVGVSGTDLVAEGLFGANVVLEPSVAALVAER
ncbi:MAG: DUF4403 family protein [Pseudomonadota bacterium]|nr:DUF4403 family protein [Pseudomonadota bacterium]